MKKILIALDYDKTAEIVANAGFELAKQMNAEITLLHVVHELPMYYSVDSCPSAYEMYIENVEGLKKASLNFLNDTKKRLGDESVRIIVKDGEIAWTILETAKEINADILVIGSHSRKWLESITMGDDAKMILKRTTIPVYVVPFKKGNKQIPDE